MQQTHPSRPYHASKPVDRPPSRLPEGYSPGSSLPPGYLPPQRDWQRTGEMVRKAQHSKLSRRQILTLAGIAGAILIVIAIVGAIILNTVVAQSSLPEPAIEHYFSSLRARDYASAYSFLSPSRRAGLSQQDYIQQSQQLEVINGPVVSFTVDSVTTNGSHATATVHAKRGNDGRVEVDNLQLVLVDSTWYMDSVTTRMEFPTPTPAP
jgi:hypothetical protein